MDICFSDLIVIQQLDVMVIIYSNSLVFLMLDFIASHKQFIVNDWNLLPINIVDAPDVASYVQNSFE